MTLSLYAIAADYRAAIEHIDPETGEVDDDLEARLSRPRSVVMDERVTTLEAEVAKLRAVVDAAIAMRDSYGVSTKLRLALEALETGHG
ncbi:MAG: hypothetical protein DRQ64_00405 [Gammaproteobacteria bacterium]|nr:MAG: hypothetical protein DRQ64_00405 [Gammaproteobacteria bacterium]